ncbi:MAG: MFS transporter, partial [Pseudomonadales bacterium]|nr:MFS transporter [Pseudomonadales bacterium]
AVNSMQTRWQMAVVLAVSIIIALFDRLNINFAMPLIAEDMGWSDKEIGEKGMWLAAMFYVTYGLANIFLTPVAERFGPRKSLLVIVILWCVFTAMGAVLSQIYLLFIAARILLGVAEGVHFPMMNLLTKRWFPLHERSRGNSVWAAGMFLSMILAPLILVPMMDTYGWRSTFILMAILGLVITFPLIYFFVYDEPGKHPRISANELSYLQQHQVNNTKHQEQAKDNNPPMKQFLLSKHFLLLITISGFHYIIVYGIVTWLPTYFNKERGIEFGDLSLPLMLPYLSSVVALPLWSYLGDKTNTRALSAGSAYILAAICCFIAISLENVWISLIFISAAIFFASAYNSAEWAFVQRVVPDELVGKVGGVYNGISVLIGGVLGSVIVGSIASSLGSFSAGFFALGVMSIVVAGLLFVLARLIRY